MDALARLHLRALCQAQLQCRILLNIPGWLLMKLIINGESRSFPPPLSLAQLVDTLSLVGKRIAIEKNGEIVPRSLYAETLLVDNDRLEIVVAVGGG